jgi:hypothetical protein
LAMTTRWMAAGMLVAAVASGATAGAQTNFTPPTADELSMTSLQGYPGASAVVLNREEITKDDLHAKFFYQRIKILTKEGEKYANVELPFVSTDDDYGSIGGDNKTLEDITGRTIHPDGKIIPFTGKPYLKVIEKDKGLKLQERVFTLPDVEVGSIIEYRYATRIADNMYESPDWYVQGDLYLKSAHFIWYPTARDLNSERGLVTTITWFPILPPGAQVERHDIPHGSSLSNGPIQYFELNIKDVPPQAKEMFMPPIASYSYRVLFNFTAERNSADWWKAEGKDWSKRMDSFADPNSDLKKQTAAITAGATTDDEKVKKIYATVMGLENTHFTRQHEQREDKAEGGGQVKNAADVLNHKRGTQTQLTELFVGMARAAGLKAYFMYVPDRSVELFTPGWLSFRQFDDVIAIVNVDGKEKYFDPGCRYCGYGHLAWQHTLVQGLRQVDKGTDFGGTSGDDLTFNQVTRVANLRMDDTGQITGKIDLGFAGADGVEWRHKALGGDEESLNRALRTHLEDMVPKTLQVKVDKVENLTEYDQPLKVSYEVTGTLGTHTGKRMILPSDLFLSGSSATFSDEKREQAVYFEYPMYLQDAVRLNLPETMSVEGTPATVRFDMPKQEVYTLSVVSDAKGFTTRRNHLRTELLVLTKDYDALRKYYAQFESKDQESVVLKSEPVAAAASGN